MAWYLGPKVLDNGGCFVGGHRSKMLSSHTVPEKHSLQYRLYAECHNLVRQALVCSNWWQCEVQSREKSLCSRRKEYMTAAKSALVQIPAIHWLAILGPEPEAPQGSQTLLYKPLLSSNITKLLHKLSAKRHFQSIYKGRSRDHGPSDFDYLSTPQSTSKLMVEEDLSGKDVSQLYLNGYRPMYEPGPHHNSAIARALRPQYCRLNARFSLRFG